jgi:hypothetical protein
MDMANLGDVMKIQKREKRGKLHLVGNSSRPSETGNKKGKKNLPSEGGFSFSRFFPMATLAQNEEKQVWESLGKLANQIVGKLK